MAPYRTCLECGHIYQTEADLIDADRATHEAYRAAPWYAKAVAAGEFGDPGPYITPHAAEIYACPDCTHDFQEQTKRQDADHEGLPSRPLLPE